ncbi:hypothetical protein KA005_22450 [bacterium]|nr:hypothetical protein [bacterium]
MALTLVPCPKFVWTLVAENVKQGMIHIPNNSPHKFLQTWVATGDTAPDDNDQSTGAAFVFPGMPIRSNTGIDVYLMSFDNGGIVRFE